MEILAQTGEKEQKDYKKLKVRHLIATKKVGCSDFSACPIILDQPCLAMANSKIGAKLFCAVD